jgi:hypothetical protein
VFPAQDFLVDGVQLLLHLLLGIVAKLHSRVRTFSSYWYLVAAVLPSSASLVTSRSSRYALSFASFPKRR